MHVDTAATTDVGQVRNANEDGYYEGESVFAVADGMGGHLAGEIASATALEPLSDLDGRVFPDASTAITALRDAVVRANDAVAEKAADDPSYRGMGTTLTAAMLEGRRLHVAHVGDSRAYLLRAGTFSQLTDDHTLVQHLIDEGRLTAEEAESHPQRSIVTRAIGVSSNVDVDTLSLDLEDGDQILLCSDGLTGVISDRQIGEELAKAREGAAAAAARLVSMANDRGGPDNITVVLLRVLQDSPDGNGPHAQWAAPPPGDPTAPPPGDPTAPSPGDPAAPPPGDPAAPPPGDPAAPSPGDDDAVLVPRPPTDGEDHYWADRLSQIGTFGKAPRKPFDERRRGPTRSQRIGAGVLTLVLLVGLTVAGGWWLLARSYYVGVDGTALAVYRGVPGALGPLDLSWLDERTEVELDDVPGFYHRQLEKGIPAHDRADALRIAEALRREEEAAEESDAIREGPDRSDATPAGAGTPSASPRATTPTGAVGARQATP